MDDNVSALAWPHTEPSMVRIGERDDNVSALAWPHTETSLVRIGERDDNVSARVELEPARTEDWGALPNHVCMLNARTFTTKEPMESTVEDGGGRRSYRLEVEPPSAPVVWRDALLLAWFTCEGNLHHFMRQTLHPIVHALSEANFSGPPLLGIVASSGMNRWRLNESWCHGPAYRELLGVFGLDATIVSFPPALPVTGANYVPGDERGQVYPDWNKRWRNDTVYCFRETRQVHAGAYSHSVVPRLMAWAGCVPEPVRVVIVQRAESRRILNAQELARAASTLNDHVSVAVLEALSLQEQVRLMACGSVVVAGVHGAGLEWVTLWEQTGSLSALIEWGWRDWGSYYAGSVGPSSRAIFRRLEDESIKDPCPVPREAQCCCPQDGVSCGGGQCPWPTKFVDIVVNVETWLSDLKSMLEFVTL